MKYLYKSKIVEVTFFVLFNDNLYYVNDNDNLFENKDLIMNAYGIEATNFGVFAYNNLSDVKTFIILQKEIIETALSLSSMPFNGIDTILKTKFNGVKKNGIYNIFTKKIKWLDNLNVFGQCLRYSDFFIYRQGYYLIKSLSLPADQNNWETNLEPYGEIRKILGVQSEKLWVSMDRCGEKKDKNSLLGLDVNTGKILYQAPSAYDLSDWFIELIPEQNTILSIYGKISTYGPAASPFIEINATTGAVMRNERIESLYNSNLKLGKWKYLNNKIYFTAAIDTINSTHIGVLDYQTLDLLWYTEVKDRKGGLRDLQVTADKIYILDAGNQLHIFEKEE